MWLWVTVSSIFGQLRTTLVLEEEPERDGNMIHDSGWGKNTAFWCSRFVTTRLWLGWLCSSACYVFICVFMTFSTFTFRYGTANVIHKLGQWQIYSIRNGNWWKASAIRKELILGHKDENELHNYTSCLDSNGKTIQHKNTSLYFWNKIQFNHSFWPRFVLRYLLATQFKCSANLKIQRTLLGNCVYWELVFKDKLI